jgi:small subunit ribosomal protein S10
MPKKIYVRTPPSMPKERRKAGAPSTTRHDDRILVHMESEDPRLLDSEARRLYEILANSGAKILGPIPIPIKVLTDAHCPEKESRIHRRFMKILTSTEETISALEKLPVSHHISISFEVEDTTSSPLPLPR